MKKAQKTKATNIVFLVPILAIVLGTSVYLLFIGSFNKFGMDDNRWVNVLGVYKDVPQNSILFIGDSQIREDIDCLMIDSKDVACFNLGIDGISPIQIALQEDYITSSDPREVIFGVSPLFFNEDINKNDDFFFFANELGRIDIDKFIFDMLNDGEKGLVSKGRIGRMLYKRKFILPFYLGILGQAVSPKTARGIENNFKNPYFFTESQTPGELAQKLNDTMTLQYFDMNRTSKREWESLAYLAKKLQDSGIRVVIMQMPLNPLLKGALDKDSMEKYHNRLSKLSSAYNITLADFEDEFGSEYFNDLTHLDQEGRASLSNELLKGDHDVIQ